ncbi:MAG: hypothetical protein ACYTFY_20175 [Planctomycetota bacterium]|jgi:hypothetical protein
MKNIYLSIIFSCLIALTGCQNIEMTYDINPDGSGKMQIKAAVQAGMLQFGHMGEKTTKEKAILNQFKTFQKSYPAIKVWDKIDLKILEDGSGEINAVGYFENINALRTRQNYFSPIQLNIEKNEKDTFNAVAKMSQHMQQAFKATDKKLTDEEITAKLTELKKNVANMKRTFELQKQMNQAHQNFNLTLTVNASNKINKVSGFAVKNEKTIFLTMDIKKYEEFINKLESDEKLQREFLKETGSANMQVLSMAVSRNPGKWLLGADKGLTASWKAGEKPLFDFQKEFASAKEFYNKWLKKQGEAPIPVAGDKLHFSKLALLGIQKIFYTNQQNNIRPFYRSKGVSISLYGILPQSVVSFEHNSSEILKAISENNDDLLPKNQWENKIQVENTHYRQEFKDSALFKINLNEKALKAEKIKLLEGVITYKSGENITKEETDIFTVKEDQKSQLYDSKISAELKRNALVIKLEYNGNRKQFKGIVFADKFGNKLNGYNRSSNHGNDKSSMEYHVRNGDNIDEFKIIFEKYKDIKEGEIRFAVENIPLNIKELPEDHWPNKEDGKSLKLVKQKIIPIVKKKKKVIENKKPQEVELF